MTENEANACFQRGKEYYDQDKYDKAIDEFTKAVTSNWNIADAKVYLASSCHLQGGVHYSNDEYSKAIKFFTMAIDLNQDDVHRSFKGRGMSYLCLEQWDKVISDFTRVVEHDKSDEHALSCLGEAYKHAEQWQLLYDNSCRIIEFNSNNPLAYGSRGYASFRMNQFEAAISDFSEAISRMDDIGMRYLRGDAYLRTRQWKLAYEDLKMVLDKDPAHKGAKASMEAVKKAYG